MLSLYLGAAGIQIVPVIGKDLMPTVAKLMRLMGRKPIFLADLDGFADGIGLACTFSGDQKAEEAAQEKGHTDLSAFARTVYAKFCEAVDSHWRDIAQEASKHHYWTNHNGDERIAKRRAAMAMLMTSTQSQISHWKNSETWCSLHRRLTAFFDFMETIGCFFLRKGTIENYYKFTSSASSKVSAAAEEAEKLIDQNEQFLWDCYGDIIRALKYASDLPNIDESSAVSELLLAAVAPALQSFNKETNDLKPNKIVQKILGDRASLFDLSVIQDTDDEPVLRAELNSKVLNVHGFPVDFPKNCNPLQITETKLRQKTKDEGEKC